MLSYNTLFSGIGNLNTDESTSISHSDYSSRYVLYAFNLSSNLDDDDHFNLVRYGNVRQALRFSTVLPTTGTVIAYAEFDNVIYFDRKCKCWSTSEYECSLSVQATMCTAQRQPIRRCLQHQHASVTTAWPDGLQLGPVALSGHALDCNVHCPLYIVLSKRLGEHFDLMSRLPCTTVRK